MLTANVCNWFESEYQELFRKLYELAGCLNRAALEGNEKRVERLRCREKSIELQIIELDRVLTGVFHATRTCHPDEFFPELDRFEVVPIEPVETSSEPSEEQLNNSWQEDLIESYRRER